MNSHYSKQFVLLALLASLLAGWFATRNIDNSGYLLKGESIDRPFVAGLLGRATYSWDKNFGFGFSNSMNSPGEALYVPAYSGARYVADFLALSLASVFGHSNLIILVISYFTCLAGVFLHISLEDRIHFKWYETSAVALFVWWLIISTGFYTIAMQSGVSFALGLGLLLIVLYYHRVAVKFALRGNLNLKVMAIETLVLSSLLYSSNQYFLALMLYFLLESVVSLIHFKERRTGLLKYYLSLLAICGVIVFIGYSYLTLHTILFGEARLISGQAGRQPFQLATPLLDIITLTRFASLSKPQSFFIWGIPVMVLSGIIAHCLSKKPAVKTGFPLFALLFFVFLLKGSAAPLGGMNQWIHEHVPLMSLTASSYPFFGMVHALFIFFIIRLLVPGLLLLKKRYPSYENTVLVAALLAVPVIQYNTNPDYFSGDFGKRIQNIYYPQEYYDFKEWAETNLKDGRSYYFPDDALVETDYTYSPKSGSKLVACYALPFSSTFPVNIEFSNYNPYSGLGGQYLPYFLKNHITNTQIISKIFAITNTKYVIFDKSIKKTASQYQQFAFIQEVIKNSAEFKLLGTAPFNNIEIYVNQKLPEPRLFGLSQDPIVVAGDLRAYEALEHSGIDIVIKPLLFADQLKMEDVQALKKANLLDKLIFYNNDSIDLTCSLLRSKYELIPEKIKYKSNNTVDWVTYNSVYRASDVAKYGIIYSGISPVWTVSSTGSLDYKIPTDKGRNFIILARLCLSPSASALHFAVGGNTFIVSAKTMNYTGLKWIKIGNFRAENKQSLLTVMGPDVETNKVIDSVIALTEEEYNRVRSDLSTLLADTKQWTITSKDYADDMSHFANESFPSVTATAKRTYPSVTKLRVLDQQFEYSTRFGIDDGADGRWSVAEQKENVQNVDAGSKRWQHEFHSNKWLLAMGHDTGEYPLVYELDSPAPIESLRVSWDTSFLSSDRIAQIFVSYDAKKWIAVTNSLSSDVHGEQYDISPWVQNKSKVFLKFSHFKLKESPFGTWITALSIRGLTSRQVSTNIYRASIGIMSSNRDGQYSISGKLPLNDVDTNTAQFNFKQLSPAELQITYTTDGPSLVSFNSSYSKNWLLGNRSPIHANFIGNGYLVEAGHHEAILKHSTNSYYRFFLLLSMSFILFVTALVIIAIIST